MTESSNRKVGAFDPVQAFKTTLFDLQEVVGLFESDAMTPREFLTATQTVADRLRAIAVLSINAMTSPVAEKVPDDVRDAFESEVDLQQLMTSPEDELMRMIELVKDVTTWRQS